MHLHACTLSHIRTHSRGCAHTPIPSPLLHPRSRASPWAKHLNTPHPPPPATGRALRHGKGTPPRAEERGAGAPPRSSLADFFLGATQSHPHLTAIPCCLTLRLTWPLGASIFSHVEWGFRVGGGPLRRGWKGLSAPRCRPLPRVVQGASALSAVPSLPRPPPQTPHPTIHPLP